MKKATSHLTTPAFQAAIKNSGKVLFPTFQPPLFSNSRSPDAAQRNPGAPVRAHALLHHSVARKESRIPFHSIRAILWPRMYSKGLEDNAAGCYIDAGENEMHVAIMTEHWQGALACIQSFGRRGHRVSVLHSRNPSPHAYSRFVQKRIPFDSESGTRAERAEQLLQLLRAESVDLIIPISDEDTHLLAECKAKAPEQKSLICSSLACIEVVRDREKTEQFCRENAIRIPESIQVASQQELHAAATKLGFPIVIKKSYSVASQGVDIVHSEKDLPGLERFLSGEPTLQVQKFVQGEFVGITGFAWQGQLKGSFAFRAAYEHSHGGTPPYAFSEEGGALTAMLAQVVEHLNWSGGIDLDLLRSAAGELYLLEINPRLSGTTIFPLKLGIDLPRLYEAALDNSFDALPASPAVPHPVLFISYPEEVLLLSSNPQVNFPKSIELRKRHRYVESLFLDDPGLTRNQLTQFMQLAWLAPRRQVTPGTG